MVLPFFKHRILSFCFSESGWFVVYRTSSASEMCTFKRKETHRNDTPIDPEQKEPTTSAVHSSTPYQHPQLTKSPIFKKNPRVSKNSHRTSISSPRKPHENPPPHTTHPYRQTDTSISPHPHICHAENILHSLAHSLTHSLTSQLRVKYTNFFLFCFFLLHVFRSPLERNFVFLGFWILSFGFLCLGDEEKGSKEW